MVSLQSNMLLNGLYTLGSVKEAITTSLWDQNTMILTTKQCILRYPRMSDVKAHFTTQQDQATARNFRSYPKTLAAAKEEIVSAIKENRKRQKTAENFAIIVNGEYAGAIAIHHIIAGHLCHLTYNIGAVFRGKGITSAAVKRVTAYAFKKYRLVRIEAGVRAYNLPSIRVLEKNGFRREGRKRKAFKKDGKFYDDFMYAKVK